MCTVVALFHVVPGADLVILANRDELFARASLPPRVLDDSPRIVGGVDVARGGTWLATTGSGLVVAVTNQRTHGPPDPTKRSRGEVVLEVARAGSSSGALDRVRSIDPAAYNAHNLLFGDAEAVHVAYARPDRREVDVRTLGPGVYALANDVLGSREFPRATRLEETLSSLAPRGLDELLGALPRVLGDHTLAPVEEVPDPPRGSPLSRDAARALQSVCVHTPVYGTRSSSAIVVDRSHVRRYLHAEGPPCVTPYVDLTSMFA